MTRTKPNIAKAPAKTSAKEPAKIRVDLPVEMRDVKSLKPYTRNARIIDEAAVQAVAESVRRFGFRQPVVVDQSGTVIVGHTRLMAAKRLKLDTVPVHVADLSPKEARAYRLADNRTHDNTTWDSLVLASELSAIGDDTLLAATAFTDDDLASLGITGHKLEIPFANERPESASWSTTDTDTPTSNTAAPPATIPLAIVLNRKDAARWERYKAAVGYSTDSTAFQRALDLLDAYTQDNS